MKPPVFVLLCTAAFLLNSCDIVKRQLSIAYNRNVLARPYDVIIVPGTPYDSAKQSPLYKARLLWARQLYEQGIARNIIFSGAATHSPYVEAQTMKLLADTMGIPTEHSFTESRAVHTTENIRYGVELAHQLGFWKIAVATDPFQNMYMSKYIKKNKLPIALLPFNVNDMPQYYYSTLPRVDVSTARIENFVPLERRELAVK